MADKNERISNLKNLLVKGKTSPQTKVEIKKLILALKKGNRQQILDISWNLHQKITSSMSATGYPLREDADYNFSATGTTVYTEADRIAHGDY